MLIVPTPDVEVSLVVPAVRMAEVDDHGEGEALLTVTDSTSHEVYSGTVGIVAVTTFSLTLPAITLGLPNGQYTYRIEQETGLPLSEGVLQVGLTAPDTQSHVYQPEVIRYERD